MKPRKASKAELAELEVLLNHTLKSGGENADQLIDGAAIAVFDQSDFDLIGFPLYGTDKGDDKMMVCVYMSYPAWAETYRWEKGKWIIEPHQ